MKLRSRLSGVLSLLAWGLLPTASVSQSPDGEMRAHGGPVRALAVVSEELLASASFDSTVIAWNLKNGRAQRIGRHHGTAVNALVARPDGCLVSGGEDGRIVTWCSAAAAEPTAAAGHTAAVSSLAVAPDGVTVASGGWDRTVRLWPAQGPSRILAEHAAPITSVLFSSDGATVISASHDGTLRLTPIGSSGAARIVKLEQPANAMVRGSTGTVLLAAADGGVRALDETLLAVSDIANLDGPLTAIALSPDGMTAAVGGLRTPLTLIDLATHQVKPTPPSPGLPVWAIAFSKDGRDVFTGSGDRAVRRFDARTGAASSPSIATVPPPDMADRRERGAIVFRACAACHGVTAQDTNLAGPTLYRIMGRHIAARSDYTYSAALVGMNIVWSPATIAELFEQGPTKYTPGTKMPEQRITDPEDRKALVDWLTRVTVP